MHQEQTAFENIVEKGEIACNEQFLLIPQCFLPYQISVSPFVHISDTISLFAVELEESRNGISGKGLSKYECNTTSDWLVVLHSNAAKYRKIWRTRLRSFWRMVGENGPRLHVLCSLSVIKTVRKPSHIPYVQNDL